MGLVKWYLRAIAARSLPSRREGGKHSGDGGLPVGLEN
jgi:hypothetical protein